ncbi:MAG: hypothetical protein CML99_01985 [Rhodobiaceae bacterium]|nr:hypothetical protein [Rhodobiaceae bacterium]
MMAKRKRILIKGSVVLLGGIVLLWGLMVLFPAPFAKLMLAGVRASAGLEEKVIEMPFGSVRYLEGGSDSAEAPTIVLLHGIFARKEHWVDFTRALTGSYRVIVPDLPGFGDNEVLGEGAYTYAAQLDRLAALLDELAPGVFHLVGNSMSGQLGGLYARQHPARLLSLALIGSPVGVTSPVPSDMERALVRGDKPLVVTTEEEFSTRMEWLFPDTPYIPGPVVRVWAKAEAARGDANERIWAEVSGSNQVRLEALAPELRLPSFIFWCREDRVFHFTGAQVLSNLLPDVELVSATGCGHVPMLDQPEKASQAYRAFLDRQRAPSDG